MKKPLVTVVVPTYNRVNLLKRLIPSLFAQTYSEIEIIVVNNGCTDDTANYLSELQKTDARVRVYEFEINTGSPMACYNKGIDVALGDFVCFIYDDDTLLPDAIEFLVGRALNDGAQWVVGNCIDAETHEFTFYGPIGDCEISFDDIISERFTGEAWALLRTELFDKIRFDEAMYGGESSVWLQIYKMTNAKYYHRAVRVYYKNHGANITGISSMLANMEKVFYTEQQYISLFSEDFKSRGLLQGRYFRLALISLLCGERRRSMAYITDYADLYNIHWIVFHLFLAAIPLVILRKLVVVRAHLRGVG